MTSTPLPDGPPPDLKFLKLLVTILTATMIAGLVAVIWLLVIRLPAVLRTTVKLPDTVVLPDGAAALAITAGPGWYAVVTTDNDIMIFDAKTGLLRQTVQIRP